ncbi:MAG: PadR family transcriptional regulator [Candidatus Marinimicrobia bacterium]|nr:PadR family transcriptional regulator [Candidatus Neomarinimicrobiota bacterium]
MGPETISNAEAALLGLLAEKPKHPYQIEKDVEYREMRTWTDLSMSSIYKLLKKLEDQELVSSEMVLTEDNRARKIYSISEAGRECLEIKLRALLRRPEVLKDPFHLGIYNADILEHDELISCLEFYRESVVEIIAGYVRLKDFLTQENCSPIRLAVATRPAYQWEGVLKWLDEFLPSLKADLK